MGLAVILLTTRKLDHHKVLLQQSQARFLGTKILNCNHAESEIEARNTDGCKQYGPLKWFAF